MAGGSQDLLQPNNLALSWCKYFIHHPKFFLPQLLPAPLGSKSISPPQHTLFSLANTLRIEEAVKWDHKPACGLLRFSAVSWFHTPVPHISHVNCQNRHKTSRIKLFLCKICQVRRLWGLQMRRPRGPLSPTAWLAVDPLKLFSMTSALFFSQWKYPSLAEGQRQHKCQCRCTEVTAATAGYQRAGGRCLL